MPTSTTTFLIDTAGEFSAWTVDTVTNVTVSHNTTDTDADGSGANGQMQAALATKNNNRTGHFRILKSWADLGVPAGNVATHVQVQYSEAQTVNTNSSNSDSGPFELRNSDNTVLNLTLLTALNRTTTSAYSTRDSGTVALAASESPSTQHYFRLTHRLQTPNTSGASVTILHDWIRITVTYTESATETNRLIVWLDDD